MVLPSILFSAACVIGDRCTTKRACNGLPWSRQHRSTPLEGQGRHRSSIKCLWFLILFTPGDSILSQLQDAEGIDAAAWESLYIDCAVLMRKMCSWLFWRLSVAGFPIMFQPYLACILLQDLKDAAMQAGTWRSLWVQHALHQVFHVAFHDGSKYQDKTGNFLQSSECASENAEMRAFDQRGFIMMDNSTSSMCPSP